MSTQQQTVSVSLIPRGNDGISPTIKVEEIEGGHRVTVTDIYGDHVFDVMNGEKGEPTTVSSEKIEGGHRVTFHYHNGAESIDVMDGRPDEQYISDMIDQKMGEYPNAAEVGY